ncbi:unnamed protein product [Clavelina lepadiformis]|uniref:Protein CNPPD1 n=2 Tax=Clavelina lepadiformis TaxID=159417 RepID=A0ABP0F4D3_CLALP
MDWEQMDKLFSSSELGDIGDSNLISHHDLSNRLRKTFYYSPHKNPGKDTLSFPITKAAVETFRKAAPTALGKLGHRYASRVARDACISPCSLLLGIIYVKRLSQRNPDYLQDISSSHLFLVSLMIASKYLYDEGISDEVYNDEWAASGLIETERINELEAEFLYKMDWRIFTKQADFLQMLDAFEARLAYQQGIERGWFSYTDCMCLLKSKVSVANMKKNLETLSQALCMCVVVYGSVMVASAGAVFFLRAVCNTRLQQPLPSFPEDKASLDNYTGILIEDQNVSVSLVHDLPSVNKQDEMGQLSPFTVGKQQKEKPLHNMDSAILSCRPSRASIYNNNTSMNQESFTGYITLLEAVIFAMPRNNETDRTFQTLDKCERCRTQDVTKAVRKPKYETVQEGLLGFNTLRPTNNIPANGLDQKHKPPAFITIEKLFPDLNQRLQDVKHFHCTLTR